ncbi:hypothetical protein RB195_019087 [Necator americanus]|uniref:Uncharacterized protein n=1 Tax=Necator americanus TaxID=51031 RepID=A0ABR1CFF9_NECAM
MIIDLAEKHEPSSTNQRGSSTKVSRIHDAIRESRKEKRESISNSNEVNSQIPISDRQENGPLKFPGVDYNAIQDNFKVTTHFRPVSQLTKKEIVSQINSVYDPIGLAGPLLVNFKAMMREVLEYKDLEWRDALDQPICERWNKLCKDVNNAVTPVPRSISQQCSKMCLWVIRRR